MTTNPQLHGHQTSFQEDVASDARAIANLLLDLSDSHGIVLTNLKLQKLLYFAHAETLVCERRALIRQSFEAWQMGPVVKVIYDQFKKFKDRPILEHAKAFDVVCKAWLPVSSADVGVATREIVLRTIKTYGRVSAFHLSELTHEHGGPWDRVRNRPTNKANIALRISNDLIFSHFAAVREVRRLN